MGNLKVIGRFKFTAPYEMLRLKFRKANHIMDYYVHAVEATTSKFNISEDESGNIIQEGDVDAIIRTLEQFSDKLSQIFTTLSRKADCIQTRVDLFRSVCKYDERPSASSNIIIPDFEKLFRAYFACEMLDHGLVRTATLYIERHQLHYLAEAELEVYNYASQIIRDLENGSIESCLKWCKEQQTRLLSQGSVVYALVRIYEFARMIKNELPGEAYKFAAKHLVELKKQAHLTEEAMCLFVYNEENSHRFKNYFSQAFFNEVITHFKREFRFHSGLGSAVDTDFDSIVSFGTMALRTRSCMFPDRKVVDCPTCNQPFNGLAKALPYPTRTSSVLHCKILNRMCENTHHFFATPQGFTYSQEGIKQALNKADGTFLCPITLQRVPNDQLLRLYISA